MFHKSWFIQVCCFILIFATLLSVHNKAFASTPTAKLYFSPESNPTSPLEKSKGETFLLDIMIDPGTHYVSTVKLDMSYPANAFTVNSLTINNSVFSRTLEEPQIQSGKITASIATGGGDETLVKTVKKVATLSITSKSIQTAAFVINFNAASEVLSLAPQDPAGDNMLALRSPAYISVTQSINNPSVTFSLGLDGIWASGDKVNPTNADFSNKNPLHPSRPVSLTLSDANNQNIASIASTMVYSNTTGVFSASSSATIPAGTYFVTFQTPGYLKKRLDTPVTFTAGSPVAIPLARLVAGDVDGDDQLSILDYNILLGCYSDLAPAKNCTPEKKIMTDLNDDGMVNIHDLNLFLREIKR